MLFFCQIFHLLCVTLANFSEYATGLFELTINVLQILSLVNSPFNMTLTFCLGCLC